MTSDDAQVPAPKPQSRRFSAMNVEREVGFALGRAYSWLLKVRPLPDAGMLWARFLLEHDEAANDPS